VTTCISNDYGFRYIFARQVRALAKPGDIVIGLTTSGESSNVINGLATARELEARTIALTGINGLKEPVAENILAIPSNNTALVQAEHVAIIHAWCEIFDKEFQT
jgi:D-sedoheptulose 7-phosphate isomerase